MKEIEAQGLPTKKRNALEVADVIFEGDDEEDRNPQKIQMFRYKYSSQILVFLFNLSLAILLHFYFCVNCEFLCEPLLMM